MIQAVGFSSLRSCRWKAISSLSFGLAERSVTNAWNAMPRSATPGSIMLPPAPPIQMM